MRGGPNFEGGRTPLCPPHLPTYAWNLFIFAKNSVKLNDLAQYETQKSIVVHQMRNQLDRRFGGSFVFEVGRRRQN